MNLKKSELFFGGEGGMVEALKSEIFIWKCASVDVGRIFYLVRFRPWDPTNTRFWKKTELFFNNAKQDSETTTLLAAVRCCVTATLAA